MWYHYDITFISICQEVFEKFILKYKISNTQERCETNRESEPHNGSLSQFILRERSCNGW